jgi:hypothetical protein
LEKLTDIFIAIDFSQQAESATESRASAQINVAKARLPVFHAIRQLKLTACPDFSGAMDSNTPVASVQVRVFWNTTAGNDCIVERFTG